MIKSKQFIGAVFCFAFLFAKSSFANFPSFDPLSYIPDLKQYKELVADLRNTKEQLNQIRQDLRSMGDSVRSVASYSQTVMRTVQKGAAAVSKAADVINKTLGTDIKVGEGLNKVIAGAENIQKNIVDRAVNDVGAVLDGQKLDEFVDDKKEEIGEATKGIREDIDKAKKDLNTVKGAAENVSDQVDTAKKWNDKRKEITGKDKLDEPIEFEEEEEEVSNEESIANLKKYFATIIDKNKKIASRLNDVLDMHINRLNTSAENAEKSFSILETGIEKNSIFSSKEKQDFISRIVDLKTRHQKIYDWNIVLAEKAKEKYNKEFKNKILDNLSNYEKITVAYLNGDATIKEVNDIGLQVKRDASTMNIATDKKIMNQIKKEALKLRKDLTTLSNDIKKIEDKNKIKS